MCRPRLSLGAAFGGFVWLTIVGSLEWYFDGELWANMACNETRKLIYLRVDRLLVGRLRPLGSESPSKRDLELIFPRPAPVDRVCHEIAWLAVEFFPYHELDTIWEFRERLEVGKSMCRLGGVVRRHGVCPPPQGALVKLFVKRQLYLKSEVIWAVRSQSLIYPKTGPGTLMANVVTQDANFAVAPNSVIQMQLRQLATKVSTCASIWYNDD